MPTYEYQCTTCRHRFEKFQSFSEEPVRECPECGQSVKKVISSSGIIFKGSGWYINDSKAKTNGPSVAPKEDTDSTKSGEAADKDKGGAETKKETAEPVAPVAETKSDSQKTEGAFKKSAGDSSQKSEGDTRKNTSQSKKTEPAA